MLPLEDMLMVMPPVDLLNQDALHEAHIHHELNFPAFAQLRAEREPLYQLNENLRERVDRLKDILNEVLLDKDVVQTSLLNQTNRVHDAEGVERKLAQLARGLEDDQASYNRLRENLGSGVDEADGASPDAATRARPPISARKAGLDLNAEGPMIDRTACPTSQPADAPTVEPDIIRNPSTMAADSEQTDLRIQLRNTQALLAAGVTWLENDRADSAGILEEAKGEFERLAQVGQDRRLGRVKVTEVSEFADLSLNLLRHALADQKRIITSLPPPAPPSTILPWENQSH